MASHTIILTTEQEIALLFDTEELNARQSGQPAKTIDDVLLHCIQMHLANVLRNLDSSAIDPVLENLKALDAQTLTKVLATIQSAAIKTRVQQRLTQ